MWVPFVKPYLFLRLDKAHIPEPEVRKPSLCRWPASFMEKFCPNYPTGQNYLVLLFLETYHAAQNLPISRKYQHLKPIILGQSPQGSPKLIHGSAPPCSDMQIISAIFQGEVITAEFGKLTKSLTTSWRICSSDMLALI
jgi:hypothetical protein